jgi:hypothetical protein
MSKLPDTDTNTDEGAMNYVEDIPITHYKKPKIHLKASMTTYSSIQLTVLHIPRHLLDELVRIKQFVDILL